MPEGDRLGRAVDVEGEVADVHRTGGAVVNLGADLDPGQVHARAERAHAAAGGGGAAGVVAHDPAENRLDVDRSVKVVLRRVAEVEVEEAPLAVGPGVALVTKIEAGAARGHRPAVVAGPTGFRRGG